ncbi:hypothetical protein AAFZ98_000265 [Vibrio parahaemolyticus]|nr:hypothetical protein [Vibrio parahaemolyticus]HCG5557557.1 hypothetical protein [Vibrio parahaemolyticus]
MPGSKLQDILGTSLRVQSNEWKNVYQQLDSKVKHQAIVTAVLELIKADVGASTQRTGSKLDFHLNNLEDYVQKIKLELDK